MDFARFNRRNPHMERINRAHHLHYLKMDILIYPGKIGLGMQKSALIKRVRHF